MTALVLYTTEEGSSQIKLQAAPLDKAEKKTQVYSLNQRPKK